MGQKPNFCDTTQIDILLEYPLAPRTIIRASVITGEVPVRLYTFRFKAALESPFIRDLDISFPPTRDSLNPYLCVLLLFLNGLSVLLKEF